jgi:hypothetical protein
MGRLVLNCCVLALVALPVGGCGDETTAAGGTGGDGGGVVSCEDDVCPCTEAGIRAAIAEGGGPFTFACDGPTTVVTEAEIVIDNDVTLDGEGNLTVDGNDDHRVFSVAEGVTAALDGFAVTKGSASVTVDPSEATVAELSDMDGGGIRNDGTLTLSNCTVSGNRAQGQGGGILGDFGNLTLTNCTVSLNIAEGAGGGIFNRGTLTLLNSQVSRNVSLAGLGGGITSIGGTVTLTGGWVRANVAGGGRRCEDCGGGGIALLSTEARLMNCAVFGNDSVGSNTRFDGGGGGIFLLSGTLAMSNCTISENSSMQGAGGLHDAYGNLTISFSTLSDNSPTEVGRIGGSATIVSTLIDGDCVASNDASPLSSLGYNIESPGDTCGFDSAADQANVTAEDLNLEGTSGAGTNEPRPGSVAIDVIPAEDCVDADGEPLTTDQRGEPRPGGTMCDVGAFEVQP